MCLRVLQSHALQGTAACALPLKTRMRVVAALASLAGDLQPPAAPKPSPFLYSEPPAPPVQLAVRTRAVIVTMLETKTMPWRAVQLGAVALLCSLPPVPHGMEFVAELEVCMCACLCVGRGGGCITVAFVCWCTRPW